MKLLIGNDHSAVEMKFAIKKYLEEMGHEVVNYGTDSTESCDYPEYGEKVGRAVAAGEVDCGVLICGTGVGISLAANKVKGYYLCIQNKATKPEHSADASPPNRECPISKEAEVKYIPAA